MVYGPVKLSPELAEYLEYANTTLQEALESLKDENYLRPELEKLTECWTGIYPTNLILVYHKFGLTSHAKVSDIGINEQFVLDGPEGDGGAGVRKEWKRIQNPTADDRVLAIVTYAFDGTESSVSVFDNDTIVRPAIHHDWVHTPQEMAELKQKNEDYKAASDAIAKKVENRIKGKVRLDYSAYPTNDRDIPLDNLDELAFEGKGIIIHACDEPQYKDYESPVVENPTWLDLCELFNTALEITGDYHIFLEGVVKTNREKNSIPVYRFASGS